MLVLGLTPNEILNKEFNTRFRGYDADQVNDYLDIIVADYERNIQEIHDLKQELATAKEKNEYFAQLQESLNSSIVVAQEAADRLKQNARKEAELILFEAEKEADRIVGTASDRARSIVTETEALRRSSKTYRQRLENLIRSQLEIVSGDEYKVLFDEAFETDLKVEDFREATERASQRVDQIEQKSQKDFDQASQLIPDKDQTIFVPRDFNHELKDENMSEAEAHNLPEEDPSHLDVQGSDYTIEPERHTDSVLGQTIRIDLPKQEN